MRKWIAALALLLCLATGSDARFLGGALGPFIPPYFPGDANLINASTYPGIVCDGVTDSTAGFRSLITYAETLSGNRAIAIGPGTCLVSGTLSLGGVATKAKRLWIYGSGSAHTTIKLTDNNVGFQNPAVLSPILSTLDSAVSVQAFFTGIEGLTVDVGIGNPGATGIIFHANNVGALRDVVVTSSDPTVSCTVGVQLGRAYTGPLILEYVTINGCDTGVRTNQAEYTQTLKNVTITNSRTYGINAYQNALVLANVTISGASTAIYANVGGFSVPGGNVVAGNLTLTGTGGASSLPAIKIDSGSTFQGSNVTVTGFQATSSCSSSPCLLGNDLPAYVKIDANLVETTLSAGTAPSVPTDTFTYPPNTAPCCGAWTKIPSGSNGAAIQAALNAASGGVAYFVNSQAAGTENAYTIDSQITIPSNVLRIICYQARIKPSSTFLNYVGSPPLPVFTVAARSTALEIDGCDFNNANSKVISNCVWISNPQSHSVMLRDTGFNGCQSYSGSGDTIYMVDVSGIPGVFNFLNSTVRAWQLNPEIASGTPAVKIFADGGTQKIVGLKTETCSYMAELSNGAVMNVLGGLVYTSSNCTAINGPSGIPMFSIDASGGSVMMSLHEFDGDSSLATYTNLIQSPGGVVTTSGFVNKMYQAATLTYP